MIIRNAKELGLLIRDARRQRKLTQAETALKAGVSRKWLIDLEAGKRTSELGLVIRTLKILGLEIDVRPRKARGRDEFDINDIVNAATGNRR